MKLTYLNPDDEVIGTLVVRDGQIVEATGIGRDAVNLRVVEPGTEQLLHPSDGDEWVKGVRTHYRTVYCRALLSG